MQDAQKKKILGKISYSLTSPSELEDERIVGHKRHEWMKKYIVSWYCYRPKDNTMKTAPHRVSETISSQSSTKTINLTQADAQTSILKEWAPNFKTDTYRAPDSVGRLYKPINQRQHTLLSKFTTSTTERNTDTNKIIVYENHTTS